MEKDFHYFLIYSLAKVTGSEDAEIIAYASQFTDDNNEGQFSIDGQKEFFPSKLKSNGGYYYPLMTQSLSPKSLRLDIHKYVYMPFHFLPGDNDVELKGKKNSLSTTPNSKNAKSLMANALASNNPYLIGLAVHTYADTWSHQNFTGFREEWNSVYPWYSVFKSIVPNIGHAEAGHSPDIISDVWTDHRLEKGKRKINNQERALVATKEIYLAFRRKFGKGPIWTDIKKDYKRIIDAPGYDERIKEISDFLIDSGLGPIPDYNKSNWIDEALALDSRGEEVVLKPNLTETHWYKFQQASKAHLSYVLNLIKEL